MFKPNKNLIINSAENIFAFDLSLEGKILYKLFDPDLSLIESNNLIEETVLNYSTTIDQNDTIHLVALINTGELHYYSYTDGQWYKNTIAKFNLKSNIYNQFETLIINNKLHLLYNYSNLINSNIWTIQHIVYDSKREEQYNVVRYISKKIPEPFIVDADNLGNIHILYVNYINNNSQVYHSFYSPYGKMWNPHPKLLSSDNVNNLYPYLFIDSYNNIHCLWVEDAKYKLNLKMMRMNSSGKEKYKWKEILLPNISISKGYPFMFELNNKLNLVFISKDRILVFQSEDYGNIWTKSDEEYDLKETTRLVKLRLNPLNYPDKINLAYMDEGNDGEIYLLNNFLNIDEFSLKEAANISEKTDDSPNSGKPLEAYSEPNEIAPSYIYPHLLEIKEKLDEVLAKQLTLNANLEKLIDGQNNTNKKLNMLEALLMEKTKSFWSRLFTK